jgi:hypothetical protein
MRPVKVRIDGTFWDSQIYSGELFLFTEQSSLIRSQWRTLINDLAGHYTQVQTALRVGFMDGDLFYNPKVKRILRDPVIETEIRRQLSDLSDQTCTLTLHAGSSLEVDSPFDMSIVDSDMYYGTIIAASDDGLFSCRTSKLRAGPVRTKAIKHHDASYLQVKSSTRHTAVAAAAGDDGLMQFKFRPEDRADRVSDGQVLSKRACKACDWSFQSILGWSESDAFLAKFKEERIDRTRFRRFDRILDLDDLFDEGGAGSSSGSGFTWGAREKLYRFESDGIHVLDMFEATQRSGEIDSDQLDPSYRGIIEASFKSEDVVSTATGAFGTVVELSDRLVVLRSDGGVEEFLGEPVHWRIFPRTDHYANQLHIIYDDYLEIVSFVHDYFVDQGHKLAGFSKGGASESGNDLF